MNISWYGHSCFKIQTKAKRGGEEIIIFTDPFDKSIGLRRPQGQANIVTISHNHSDHNDTELLKGDFFTADSPGEFSIQGVTIEGIDSFHDDQQGAVRGRNTIFMLESEDIRICHLGDLGQELTEKQIDAIGDIDILMVPVGGTYTLDSKTAKKVVGQIEPKIIVPMHYKIDGLTVNINDETEFCNELGATIGEKLSRISLKKRDLDEIENKVIVMSVINS